jgi:hypothetical protein
MPGLDCDQAAESFTQHKDRPDPQQAPGGMDLGEVARTECAKWLWWGLKDSP